MSKPNRAGSSPIPVDVSVGKKYWWCSCGRSQSQPFCDGSHKETAFQPVEFIAEKDETLYFCVCKQTGNAPLCDGSHSRS